MQNKHNKTPGATPRPEANQRQDNKIRIIRDQWPFPIFLRSLLFMSFNVVVVDVAAPAAAVAAAAL